MSFFKDRLFRLYLAPKSVEELSQQIQDLVFTLNSVVQDLVIMKGILEEKGLMDAALYKRLRAWRMLHDHSSAGADPWVSYSIYPYTLDEQNFLRQALNATEAEVKHYDEDVQGIQMRT